MARVNLLKKIIILYCLLSCTACATVSLYDQEKDEAAQKALETFEKIDLNAYIAARGERLSQLRADEISIARREAIIRGNVHLDGFLDSDISPSQNFSCTSKLKNNPVIAKLCELGFLVDQDEELLIKASDSFLKISNIATIVPEQNLREILGSKAPSCDDFRYMAPVSRDEFAKALIKSVGKPESKKAISAKSAMDVFRNSCESMEELFRSADGSIPLDNLAERLFTNAGITNSGSLEERCQQVRDPDTIISSLCRRWQADLDIAGAKATSAITAAKLKVIAKEIKQQSGQGAFDREKFDKELEEALKKIDNRFGELNPIVKRLGGQDGKLTALQETLQNLPDSHPNAIALLVSFAELSDATQAPVDAGLLVEQEFLRIEAQYAKDKMKFLDLRRQLALAEVKAKLTQADMLWQAILSAGRLSNCEKSISKIYQNLNSGRGACTRSISVDDRPELFKAPAYAYFAFAHLEGDIRVIKAERYHLDHLEIILERDRVLNETQSLAQGALTDLAAFYKSGVKREELIAIVGRIANLGILGGLWNDLD